MSADHQKRENLIADLLLHNIYKTKDGRHLYELSLQDLEQQFQDILSPSAQEKPLNNI
ncbi:Fur-regulated basic protein FbpA [Fictibacillus arsenicus]|uniref:Fur-regulated basic protein FbpA n=1 Tax=Fictibacillus arsenicus TaxID=255247 RepID=UPI001559D993|nr:Fur-regulated basic protein FbpA [Fictibacillus arsenicus]